MIVAGLGRASIDVHLERIAGVDRLGSRKAAAHERHRIGGSVPWILAQTAAAGCESHFIGPGSVDRTGAIDVAMELGRLGLRCHLQELTVPRSYIEHDADGRLERIVSIEEAAEDQLDPDHCYRILQSIEFDWLVLDGRHPEAARVAGGLARERQAGVLLDPGSTSGLANVLDDHSILRMATLLCVDRDLLERLSGTKDQALGIRRLLGGGLEQVVVTDDQGGARWSSRTVDLTLRPRDSRIPGSSLGLGDSFRGWLLAGLALQGRRRGEVPEGETAAILRLAMTAAHVRKHQGTRAPEPVSRQDIESSSIEIDAVGGPLEILDVSLGDRPGEKPLEEVPTPLDPAVDEAP